MKTKYFLFIILAFIISFSVNAEQYLCVAEAAGGVNYNESSRKWVSTTFQTAEKYIITPSKDKKYKYAVKELGQKTAMIHCKTDFIDDEIYCRGFTGIFRFNRKTNRFLNTYEYGYVDGRDNNKNTPHVQIGKCSPL